MEPEAAVHARRSGHQFSDVVLPAGSDKLRGMLAKDKPTMDDARTSRRKLLRGVPVHAPAPQPGACSAEFPVTPQEILAYVERLLAHPGWQGSARRGEFLRHIVSETLAGRGRRLKGTAIAMEVFGRLPGGDGAGDAIVRVEARRLRRDLDSYYVGPGRWDLIRIGVPKGGYMAVFEAQPPAPPGWAREEAPARRSAPDRRMGAPAPAPVAADPAVLVRRFAALGGGAALRDLADGLTYEVISGLMRFPGFRLHSVEDSFAGTAPPVQPAQKTPADGPAYAVCGAVQADADRLKVSVRLVEAADCRVVWSRTFTRPLTVRHMISVQSEIAGDIAEALCAPEPGLREGLIARIARSGAPSMESYLAVVAAQAYRRTNLVEVHAEVLAALEQAVRCDPVYADAWAHLAFVQMDGLRHVPRPDACPEAYAPALTAARRALALDPENIPGHIALLLGLHYTGQDAEALATGEHALRVSPYDPDVLAALGYLRGVGHNDPAGVELLERAVARLANPPPRYWRSLAVCRLMWSTSEEAVQAARLALADGTFMSAALLAAALGCAGRTAEAAEALETMALRRPLTMPDPVNFLRADRVHPEIVATLAAGLHRAGWSPDPLPPQD